MTQPTWAVRLTRMVAGEVRRYRQERGLSAQQLARRCAELGAEMSRTTIADLENERRVAISVAELVVLAAALEVPPVLLVAPLGRRSTVETLPNREMEPWTAVQWLSGQAGLTLPPEEDPEASWFDWRDDGAIVPLYAKHHELVADLTADLWDTELSVDKDGKIDPRQTVQIWTAAKAGMEDDLRQVRARMRELGLMSPELPAELAHIDHVRPRS